MKYPGFIGPTYQSRTLSLDAQRTVNLYPEIDETGNGKNVAALLGTPGLHVWGTLPATPVRGLWAGDNRLFAAGGTKLYEVNSSGTATEKGTIANDAGNTPVQMFPNGTQLFVISAGTAYIHNGTSLVSAPVPADPAVDPSFPAGQVGTAATGAFIDGYYIASKQDSKKYFLSAINNGLTWDALDFASKEGYPDNILATFADHEELWLFGNETIEVWRNEGDPDFPFRPDPGGFIHQGLAARYTPARVDNGLCWLGGDAKGRPVAWRAQGFQPIRISTHATEKAWRSYSTISDAIGYSYVDDGHSFYVLTFPTGNATWCYDATTKLWHERAYLNAGTLERHRSRCHAYVFGKHLVGDHTSGVIYEMSPEFFDDNGSDMRRIRTAPHLSDEQIKQFHHRLQLDMEAGVSVSGEETAELEWSDDGGQTWTSPRSAGIGAAGAYTKRVIWRRLGDTRDRVYRVTITGQTKIALINAYLNLTGGNS